RFRLLELIGRGLDRGVATNKRYAETPCAASKGHPAGRHLVNVPDRSTLRLQEVADERTYLTHVERLTHHPLCPEFERCSLHRRRAVGGHHRDGTRWRQSSAALQQ